MNSILFETVTRLFDQEIGEDVVRASRRGELRKDAWQAVNDLGLPLALVSEDQGGFGLDASDALEVVRIAGSHGSPLPIAETMMANRILSEARLPISEGVATFCSLDPDSELKPAETGWRARAQLVYVPWARHASTFVVASRDRIFRLEAGQVSIAEGASPACGLPRDVLIIDAVVPTEGAAEISSDGIEKLLVAGALIRSLEMAGALARILDMTITYAGERIQFGRPLGQFQAVQQQMSLMAGQVAAANAAASLAASMFGRGDWTSVAIAKARIGEAAGVVAAIAHQVHGAIGYTEEHKLHLLTKALWAWRDEYGTDLHWQRRLGEVALRSDAENFWPLVTSVGAAA